MSSARISALKGGVEAPPGAAAAHRGGGHGDPAAGFAAALGAMVNSHSPSGHHFHGSDDAATGDDRAAIHPDDGADAAGGTAAAQDASGQPADAMADATGAATAATLPGLANWLAPTGNQATAGAAPPAAQRGPAKPGAAAV